MDDDAAAGYTVGSTWINTTTGHAYILVDSTTGAAVWVSTTAVSVFSFSTSDGTTTVDPTTELTFVGGVLADLGGGVAELTLGGGPATTVTDETTWGITPAVGSDDEYARQDHTHGSPAEPVGGELLVADGMTGPNGITPTAYVEEADVHTTTSGTLEDIPDVTTTITLQRTSHVAAWLNTQISGSGVCVIGIAVNLNGSDHDEVQHAISGTDAATLSVVHRTSTELAPGTYTVKGRMRRVSGASTPEVDRADLLVMAMGHSGPVMLTTEDETDFLYADA